MITYHFLDSVSAIADSAILKSCSKLYSEHYGVWGANAKNPSSRVKLSEKRIAYWLNDNTYLCYASDDKNIIGYAIALSINDSEYGTVTWITQLVVHEAYRHRGIAKNILLSIWGFSDHAAWGIVSANPYAIRALEKITRRRAIPDRIKQDITMLKSLAIENICFIQADTEFVVNDNQSKVNTKFFVDHDDIPQKIANVTTNNTAWLLGDIEEGWEWCAFTFRDQKQIPLSNEEINTFLNTSDAIVKEAYSRMILDAEKQLWMKNEESEINYLRKIIDFSKIHFAYDLGCGIGRHAFILAKNGLNVIGIDYIESNIEQAKAKFSLKDLTFIHADCRTYQNSQKAQLVLCLYDVVGTFAVKDENTKIIKTAYDLLDKGGYAVFSVMNYESTAFYAKHKFTFSKEANKLLELKPSNVMEKTGNVFLPDYYLVDEETHVVYRKEQFLSRNKMPRELIVRDMRFTKAEIIEMCVNAGFVVIESKFVNATDWSNSYQATDKKAKEILIVCQKL